MLKKLFSFILIFNLFGLVLNAETTTEVDVTQEQEQVETEEQDINFDHIDLNELDYEEIDLDEINLDELDKVEEKAASEFTCSQKMSLALTFLKYKIASHLGDYKWWYIGGGVLIGVGVTGYVIYRYKK